MTALLSKDSLEQKQFLKFHGRKMVSEECSFMIWAYTETIKSSDTLLQLPCYKEGPCDRKGLWYTSSKWFRDIESSFGNTYNIGTWPSWWWNSECVRIWGTGRVCYNRTWSKPSRMQWSCEQPSKWVFRNPIAHQKHQMLTQGYRDAFNRIPAEV